MDQETEFWNREDDDNFLDIEEDISYSDDGVVSINAFTKTKVSSRSGINERIDWLQQAEEKYHQGKDPSKQTNVLPKNAISDSQRKAIKQHLLDTLKQNLNRIGSLLTDTKTAATFLENECYKKYGKVGNTFYNSEAASIIRWLSSSSCSEINNRLQPVSATSISSSKCDSEAPPTSLISSNKNAIQTVEGKNSSEYSRSRGDEERIVPVDLPPVPSFAEFAKQQSQASKSRSSTSLKRSPADVLKRMGHKEGSEKRVRQNQKFG